MRIVHSGWFLREGFEEMGCEVIPLRLDAAKTLDELVEQTGVRPDLVFMELFGKTNLPKEFFSCRYKLAAYCIDSALNEYWHIPLTKLFDYVYVDQLSSVSKFRRNDIRAKWLPLCASRMDFRPPADKKHLITFVGSMTSYRTKRANLINHIRSSFPVNVVQDISKAAMLDAFASSRIVLNENFFSGLNLRFFQALASGSLLLTERRGYGVNFHFQEGKHYAGYSPSDLLAIIKNIARAPEVVAPIALCGQEECKRHHTSASRARTVLEDLTSGPLHPGLSLQEKKLHEAQGKYDHAFRFGGNFDESVTLLKDCANASNEIRSHALCVLGSIHLRSNRTESGVAYLEKSATVATVHGLSATLKLMLFFADDGRFLNYLSALVSLLTALRMNSKKYFNYISLLKNEQEIYYNSCMLAYEILSDLKINFDLGFHKPEQERYPDYAMEYAILAFAAKKTVESLGAIIKCTRKGGFAPEALGYIKEAILAGAASDEQIALSASLALEQYDFFYAETTLKALKATLSPAVS
uniref:Spore protein YkvP/CgeB glycosyl transferase-like domain-containing protein n=1 Tax=Desulfovibrio sp. U5L TaxID=596152 RepID=I2PX63_9BACT